MVVWIDERCAYDVLGVDGGNVVEGGACFGEDVGVTAFWINVLDNWMANCSLDWTVGIKDDLIRVLVDRSFDGFDECLSGEGLAGVDLGGVDDSILVEGRGEYGSDVEMETEVDLAISSL